MGARTGFQAASCCHLSSSVVPPIKWPYTHTGNLINHAEETAADRVLWGSLGGLEVPCSPYGVLTGAGTLCSRSGNAGAVSLQCLGIIQPAVLFESLSLATGASKLSHGELEIRGSLRLPINQILRCLRAQR